MYAIISDIHGNYPALTAVLHDAKIQGAEQLLLLGDYTNSFPFQNEVVETIRHLPKTAYVSDEGGIIHLAHKLQQFISSPTIFLDSRGYAELLRKKPFTFEEYLTISQEWLLGRPETINALRALLIGVYLFGHSHIPVHVEFENRWLVNPKLFINLVFRKNFLNGTRYLSNSFCAVMILFLVTFEAHVLGDYWQQVNMSKKQTPEIEVSAFLIL